MRSPMNGDGARIARRSVAAMLCLVAFAGARAAAANPPRASAAVPPHSRLGHSVLPGYKSWDGPIEDDIPPALIHFHRGLLNAEYDMLDRAIEDFEEAWQRSGRAEALYNLGRAHADEAGSRRARGKPNELREHHREAIASFRRYLAEQPAAEDRARVERIIAWQQHQLDDVAILERELMAEEARRRLEVYEDRAREAQLDDTTERLRELAQLDRERNETIARLPEKGYRFRLWVRRALAIAGGAAMAAGGPLLILGAGKLAVTPFHNWRDTTMTVAGGLLAGFGLAAEIAALLIALAPDDDHLPWLKPVSDSKARVIVAPGPGGIFAAGVF